MGCSTPSLNLDSVEVKCGNCKNNLPLRLSSQGETAAVWLCAECSMPFMALCLQERLTVESNTVRLHERYFDISNAPEISPALRRHVAQLASREAEPIAEDKRRSQRISQSLVVPAVCLNNDYCPDGEPFQLMVANLSREGIGLVHDGSIDAKYVAIELGTGNDEPIQVIVRLIRQCALVPPYREIGGEFYVRLGNPPA